MALAQKVLKSGRGVNGSAFFVDGMSTAVDPMFISDRAYRDAMNTIHRGGVVQTRPGFRSLLDLPAGRIQGGSYFRPTSGAPWLVFAIAGNVYASQYPFLRYQQLSDVSLRSAARDVYFTTAIQSAQRLEDGSIQTIEPRRVLVMQDGRFSRAAYFDGGTAGHIDPSDMGTPLGSAMEWVGDRLWVARGNKLFAGDIGNPFSFAENEYAAEGGFFQFPEDIVALAKLPSVDDPDLIVLCENSTHLIRASIRDRASWKTTALFKREVLPGVGATSHRGQVAQYGMLWWMTDSGITNLNAATAAKLSSKLSPQDVEMSAHKAYLDPRLSTVAAASFGNFLLFAVPHGDKLNSQIWVYDQAVAAKTEEAASGSWSSVWTGVRPVEFLSGKCDGVRRLFFLSADYDGVNRLWEAFDPSNTDDGGDIRAYVETKTHIEFSDSATGLDYKRFIYGDVYFTNVLGDVSGSVYWAGERGLYKKLGDFRFNAEEGSLHADENVGVSMETYRGQVRKTRTPNAKQDASQCSSCGKESNFQDFVDVGFSLLVVWNGRAALKAYRIYADPFDESSDGAQMPNEAAPVSTSGAICTQ